MSKTGIFHFFALTIVGIGYSTAEPQKKMQPRIINGNVCKTTEVPYFVIVRDIGICGGFLVTYEWVLTSAHCILPKYLPKDGTKIYSGFDMPPELSQVRKVKEFHPHPKFVEKEFMKVKDFRYDIGLLLVDKPFRQTAVTHVATLPALGFAKPCKQVMVPGIGYTSNKEYIWDKPATIRPVNCVNLSIIDNETCKKQYAQGRTILFDDTIMCMQGSMKGVCNGDSGGPVLCDNVAIGINSMAPKDCESAPMGTTFTLIESHLDFIYNTVKFTGIQRS